MQSTRREALKVLGGALLLVGTGGCRTQAQERIRASRAEAAEATGSGAVVGDAVRVLRVPEGGVQPQVVARGAVVHMVYLKGDPAGGDVFYVRSNDEGSTWSAPLRVNSQPQSAIAMGTIRGAHLAIGKNGRVHVAWNGSGKATPRVNGGSPMLYARLNDGGDAFEEQRNLMQDGFQLDGGGTVAADEQGRVYVAWHAGTTKDGDEESRRVFVTRSTDEGKTWSTPASVWDEPTGVCACCQLRLMAKNDGKVLLFYRSATATVNRDSYLLHSKDAGKSFVGAKVHPWQIGACPMSSYSLAPNGEQVVGAWESDKQVFFSAFNAGGKATAIQSAPGRGNNRKHPALAVNASGETLLVWTEGTAWARGGRLRWQRYDARGQAISGQSDGRSDLPVWDFGTAWAGSNGRFTIVY